MELTLPAGHAYPAVQLPVQAAVVSVVALPYVPPGHSEQDAAPVREYCPAGHGLLWYKSVPVGQKYPGMEEAWRHMQQERPHRGTSGQSTILTEDGGSPQGAPQAPTYRQRRVPNTNCWLAQARHHTALRGNRNTWSTSFGMFLQST